MAAFPLLLVILGLSCPCSDAVRWPSLNHRRVPSDEPMVNERPIIGILTQPGSPAPEGGSYIAASYVKWIEAAGARVAPIFYDDSDAGIRAKFQSLNGVLLPGGGARLSPGHRYYDAAALLVKLAVEANDAGDYFPLHGTCLGLETLAIVISGNYSLLSPMEAEGAAAPLLYTDLARDSHFFSSLPPAVVRGLQNRPLAMENHMKGLLMTSYDADRRLRDFFKVLSLSLDQQGLPYVSTLEARKYPVTATQWHPEKNQFEWSRTLGIPHGPDAVVMGQEIANFFVREARASRHAPPNQDAEDRLLIYRWPPAFTGRAHRGGGAEETDFLQSYLFPGPKRREEQDTEFAASRRR